MALMLLVPYSRNEKAAALPSASGTSKKLQTAAPVVPAEDSDTELDRYGARSLGKEWGSCREKEALRSASGSAV